MTIKRTAALLRYAAIGCVLAHTSAHGGDAPSLSGETHWDGADLFTVHRAGPAGALLSSAMKRAGDIFTDEATGLRVEWRATNHKTFARQEITLTATRGPVGIDRVEMVRMHLPGARITGPYDGMPVVTDGRFIGIEHPMARNQVRSPSEWSPLEMRARVFDVPIAGITGGEVQVRFDYQSGNHRIDVAGVALVDPAGKTLSEDAHAGFSGLLVEKNTYRLAVPGGVHSGTLRVTLGGDAAQTDSNGRISLSGAAVAGGAEVVCSLPRQCELKPGEAWKVSAAVGAYPPGQLRRAFLDYLEQSRAHSYRQYWHYNSWYDLNIGRNDNPDPLKRMTEAQCLDVINAFGTELYEKRGVGLNGFVWDDGWDDWNSLWGFHAGFPNGFTKLKEAAVAQGAGMGAWLSPWGGYGGSHDRRVAYGRSKGYEVNAGGFSLGGERYYTAFRDTCLKMIRDYNQNYFKFDGIGGGTWATGAPASVAPDLDALIRLCGDLRRANPDVFINCTVGTWPSPYWTFVADSIWRGGEDFSRAGEGNPREQWITYRDGVIHGRFVEKSPLYPLNSLMYHGLLVAPHAGPAAMPTPAQDLESYRHEVLMSVACGSGLGELYVTPSLMTPAAWDILAGSLKWNRAHKDILRDAHWVGGKPGAAVYGYAGWHPQQGGTLVLRNSTGAPQTFVLNPQAVFELPADAPGGFTFSPVLHSIGDTFRASAGQPATLMLQPFQVVVLDAAPLPATEAFTTYSAPR